MEHSTEHSAQKERADSSSRPSSIVTSQTEAGTLQSLDARLLDFSTFVDERKLFGITNNSQGLPALADTLSQDANAKSCNGHACVEDLTTPEYVEPLDEQPIFFSQQATLEHCEEIATACRADAPTSLESSVPRDSSATYLQCPTPDLIYSTTTPNPQHDADSAVGIYGHSINPFSSHDILRTPRFGVNAAPELSTVRDDSKEPQPHSSPQHTNQNPFVPDVSADSRRHSNESQSGPSTNERRPSIYRMALLDQQTTIRMSTTLSSRETSRLSMSEDREKPPLRRGPWITHGRCCGYPNIALVSASKHAGVITVILAHLAILFLSTVALYASIHSLRTFDTVKEDHRQTQYYLLASIAGVMVLNLLAFGGSLYEIVRRARSITREMILSGQVRVELPTNRQHDRRPILESQGSRSNLDVESVLAANGCNPNSIAAGQNRVTPVALAQLVHHARTVETIDSSTVLTAVTTQDQRSNGVEQTQTATSHESLYEPPAVRASDLRLFVPRTPSRCKRVTLCVSKVLIVNIAVTLFINQTVCMILLHTRPGPFEGFQRTLIAWTAASACYALFLVLHEITCPLSPDIDEIAFGSTSLTGTSDPQDLELVEEELEREVEIELARIRGETAGSSARDMRRSSASSLGAPRYTAWIPDLESDRKADEEVHAENARTLSALLAIRHYQEQRRASGAGVSRTETGHAAPRRTRKTPLTMPQIESYTKKLRWGKTTSELVGPSQTTCAICLVDFTMSDGVSDADAPEEEWIRVLPCDHCFHSGCVEDWLMTKPTCPLCRKHVVLTGREVRRALRVVESFRTGETHDEADLNAIRLQHHERQQRMLLNHA